MYLSHCYSPSHLVCVCVCVCESEGKRVKVNDREGDVRIKNFRQMGKTKVVDTNITSINYM